MHHLILGYGYCGFHLAQELLENGEEVTAVSRHLHDEWKLPGLQHQSHDLHYPFQWDHDNSTIYYLIPPPSSGEQDTFLKLFLSQSRLKAKRIIYFGSSGVYGNQQGKWVTEDSPCQISHARQLRRIDAEQQWHQFSSHSGIAVTILRIAGIYGPHRLPIEAARARIPLIERDKAPYTNHVYVKDLVKIASLFSRNSTAESIFNIADGEPHLMGSLQEYVGELLQLKPAPTESWSKAWERASPMKREFMESSKRLCVDRLKSVILNQIHLTSLKEGIASSLAIENS